MLLHKRLLLRELKEGPLPGRRLEEWLVRVWTNVICTLIVFRCQAQFCYEHTGHSMRVTGGGTSRPSEHPFPLDNSIHRGVSSLHIPVRSNLEQPIDPGHREWKGILSPHTSRSPNPQSTIRILVTWLSLQHPLDRPTQAEWRLKRGIYHCRQ